MTAGSFLTDYAKRHGTKAALSKIKQEMAPHRLKDRYLRVLGVYDGEFAYRGPHYVQIDLTNQCNNACIACWCNSPLYKTPRLTPREKNESLPLDLVKRLLDELAAMGTREIGYSGSGEPFMHPQIMEILAYTKKKNLSCIVNTNFTLVDQERIRRLADIGLDSLTISLWAATPAMYARTHPGRTEEDFIRIKENLMYLNAHKKEKPSVYLYNVIFNMNYSEIEAMVDVAVQTGSEMVGFALVDTMPQVTDVLLLNEPQLLELRGACERIRARLDARSRLDPEGTYVNGIEDFARKVSAFSFATEAKYDRNVVDAMPCYNGWLFARVVPNGEVHSCLKAHRIPTGSLLKNTFAEIWNSPKQAYFRKKTCVYRKDDLFFRLIGNDPDIREAGCYKSCDDIGRNAWMHQRIAFLTVPEKVALAAAARLLRTARMMCAAVKGASPLTKKIRQEKRHRRVLSWILLCALYACGFFCMTVVGWLRRRRGLKSPGCGVVS